MMKAFKGIKAKLRKINLDFLLAGLVGLHIFLIILASLPQSQIYKSLPRPALLYLNQIGLNNPWNMFAPDPMPDVKIDISYYPDDQADKPTYQKTYPQNKSLYGLSAIRPYYLLNYFLARETRIYEELGLLLCQKPFASDNGYWLLSTQRQGNRQTQSFPKQERLMACAQY